MTYAYVFFSSADWSHKRRLGIRKRVRILLRFPQRSFYWLLSYLIRKVTRCQWAHVCIGDGEVVLDPGLRGNRFWSHYVFLACYPTLIDGFVLPISNDLDLDSCQAGGPKQILPTWKLYGRVALRWWTCGWVQTEDCVCVCVKLLRVGGVRISPRIFSPRQLHTWLEDHGYQAIQLNSEHDKGSG